jgi:hypothetical protein
MSLILIQTSRLTPLAAAAFSYRAPDSAPLTRSLLAPLPFPSRAPPAPRFDSVPRRPLPLVAHAACQAELRPVLLVVVLTPGWAKAVPSGSSMDGGGADAPPLAARSHPDETESTGPAFLSFMLQIYV